MSISSRDKVYEISLLETGKLKCSECGCDKFVYYGESNIGGFKFDGFRCYDCGSGVAIEVGTFGLTEIIDKNLESEKTKKIAN